MKNILVILILVVSILSYQLFQAINLNKQQEKKIEEFTKNTNANLMNLQEKCSKQASFVFKEQGYSVGKGDTYSSHYNRKLNICYVSIYGYQINKSDISASIYHSVMNAFEQKAYATYVWYSVPGKKYWEVPPTSCTLDIDSESERTCNNEKEYLSYEKNIMSAN